MKIVNGYVKCLGNYYLNINKIETLLANKTHPNNDWCLVAVIGNNHYLIEIFENEIQARLEVLKFIRLLEGLNYDDDVDDTKKDVEGIKRTPKQSKKANYTGKKTANKKL